MILPREIIKVSIRWRFEARKIGGVYTALFERMSDAKDAIESFLRDHEDADVEAPEIVLLSNADEEAWVELEYVPLNYAYIRAKRADS